MRGWPSVLLSLATRSLLCACAGSAAAATVDVDSIWNGQFVPGRPIELAVDPGMPDGGIVTITVTDPADPSIRHRRSVDASSRGTTGVRLPVTAVSQPRLALEVETGNLSRSVLEVVLEPLPSDRAVVVISGATLGDLTLPGVTVLRIAATALPHYAESYRFLDVLALDRHSIADLSDVQLDALEGFVGQCGRILLHDVPSAAVVRATAGCNGRGVVETTAGSDLAGRLEDLVQMHGSLPPTPAAMETLLDTPPAGAHTATHGFFALYLATMAVLLLRRAPMPALLVAPPALAALTVFTLSGVTPESDWVRWSETDASSGSVPFTSLLRVSGNGHGRTTLELPGAPLHVGQGASDMEMEISYERRLPTASLDTRLYSERLITFSGYTAAPSLTLAAIDGVPVITNAGARASAPTTLAWRDVKYRVPALAPASRWSPQPDAAVDWNHTPAERLFRVRAQPRVAALLLVEPAAISAAHQSSRAFTMVTL